MAGRKENVKQKLICRTVSPAPLEELLAPLHEPALHDDTSWHTGHTTLALSSDLNSCSGFKGKGEEGCLGATSLAPAGSSEAAIARQCGSKASSRSDLPGCQSKGLAWGKGPWALGFPPLWGGARVVLWVAFQCTFGVVRPSLSRLTWTVVV